MQDYSWDEIRSSWKKKCLYYNQLKQKNLSDDTWVLIIILEVSAVQPNGTKATFHRCLEGLNVN